MMGEYLRFKFFLGFAHWFSVTSFVIADGPFIRESKRGWVKVCLSAHDDLNMRQGAKCNFRDGWVTSLFAYMFSIMNMIMRMQNRSFEVGG